MKRILIVTSLLTGLIFQQAFSQPGVGNPGGGGKPGTVPISGLEVLLGAGALFGVKKILSKRNSLKN